MTLAFLFVILNDNEQRVLYEVFSFAVVRTNKPLTGVNRFYNLLLRNKQITQCAAPRDLQATMDPKIDLNRNT